MSKDKNIIILGKGENIAEVQVRKSHLAKRVSIRINAKKGIELVVPKRASLKYAIEFLHKKEQWVLIKNLELKRLNKRSFTEGTEIPILGKKYIIKHSGKLRGLSRIEGNNLVISGLKEHIPRKTRQFLIKMAKEEISIRAKIEAEKLRVKFASIAVKDTKSRWGSCSRSGNLSFSWRLIMAPRGILEYVVAHEISHLREMNHSKKFWDIVASIFPNYKKARQWLRVHGDILHSYDD